MKRSSRPTEISAIPFLFLCVLAVPLAPGDARAATDGKTSPAARCTNTATAGLQLCRKEASAAYWQAKGMCENLPAVADRNSCVHDATGTRSDDWDDCDAQLEARQALCDALGESAYAPSIDPANFTTTIDNPLLPLVPGTVSEFENTDGEHVEVTVTHDTLPIAGVDTVVVHDVDSIAGDTIEDTFDYYAEDMQGNVWYFGEDTVEYDHGVITSVEGAWRTGVDGARPGIVMEAAPAVGDVYRQEFLLGVAEDQAEVLDTDSTATVPFGGTYNGCLKTSETSGLEPDSLESKYYASGVGLVLTVDEVTGDREELTNVTVGP